ncbi:SHOCT domain-containing protein [Halostagnicola kamekurae]|uniref:Short C-terminal domain-containing protein n=1 Tax=Halostagnicola kamekurae TaxID=619731 RepID=A0A1I6U6R4_9EURY|nr:SHOCT domain-containing protein [Halostagnicola kamekurae]SFS97112.1 Short C-terminal domain-containing protein [Halostagnicola kamekurae]
MERPAPLERASEHLAEVLALVSMGVAVVGATLEIEWLLLVDAIGFVVGTPLAFLLEGDDETGPKQGIEVDGATRQQRDPVETLKTRYAEGTISDEEFERDVGRLLEGAAPDKDDGPTREPSVADEGPPETDAVRIEDAELDREPN